MPTRTPAYPSTAPTCQRELVALVTRDGDLSTVTCPCGATYRISHPERSLAEAELGLWKVVMQ